MAKVNVTPNEFADLVVIFLFDKFLHPNEIVSDNKLFNELIDNMRGKGMKPLLMNYYMDLDANMRVKYKRIKDVLDGTSSESSVINILPEKVGREREKKKVGSIRKIVKKLMKKEEISMEEENLLLGVFEDEGKDII